MKQHSQEAEIILAFNLALASKAGEQSDKEIVTTPPSPTSTKITWKVRRS